MFGQDKQSDDISAINPTLDTTDTSAPTTDTPADTASTDLPAADATAASDTPTVDTPATDITTPDVAPEETPEVPTPDPVAETPEVEETPAESTDSTSSDSTSSTDTPTADPALLDLKKQALEELSPLLDQLDQTPEEKFKTTMMMIQATDSSELIKSAHEAALQISDEKVRAQALLDVVNEINYFTQPKE